MIPLYHKLIQKFARDAAQAPKQMLVLGDIHQSIYDFKGANWRFLKMCDQVWVRPFTWCNLRTTYRLTHQMAHFVNEYCDGRHQLQAAKDGPPVHYHRGNPYVIAENLAKDLLLRFQRGTLRPEDVLVLAFSLRTHETPIRTLENTLVEHGVPCFFHPGHDIKKSEGLLQGKVAFHSFHKSKGRQRPYVIVFGFDSSFYASSRREVNGECPNELYVACTRAEHEIHLVHDAKHEPLPTLQGSFARMKNDCAIRAYGIEDLAWQRMTAEQLTEFLSSPAQARLDILTRQLFIQEQASYQNTQIPSVVGKETSEYVAHITGLVIPALFEQSKTGQCTLLRSFEKEVADHREKNKRSWLLTRASPIAEACQLGCNRNSISHFLEVGLLHQAFSDGLLNAARQVRSFEWLSQQACDECMSVLERHVGNTEFKYEVPLSAVLRLDPRNPINIVGRVDMCNAEQLLELKCTDSLLLEHKLQLLIYAYLCLHQEPNSVFRRIRAFRLLNLRTGERWRLDATSLDKLAEVMQELLQNKRGTRHQLSDAEFILQCQNPELPD
jgi:hypothetical protein